MDRGALGDYIPGVNMVPGYPLSTRGDYGSCL
jgi:hypothetical protein